MINKEIFRLLELRRGDLMTLNNFTLLFSSSVVTRNDVIAHTKEAMKEIDKCPLIREQVFKNTYNEYAFTRDYATRLLFELSKKLPVAYEITQFIFDHMTLETVREEDLNIDDDLLLLDDFLLGEE